MAPQPQHSLGELSLETSEKEITPQACPCDEESKVYERKRPVYTQEENLTRRNKIMGGGTQIHYPELPLRITHGRGQYLFEENGNRYLDLMNNVAHVGHCHPHVTRGGQQQMSELYTNCRFLHDEIVTYIERLTATFPEKLCRVYLCCTGTEATDLAIRLARTYTKKHDAIVLDRAYHGHSVAAIELSPYKFATPGGVGKAEHVHVTPCPDVFRGLYRGEANDPSLGEKYADEVKKILDEQSAKGRQIAFFIAESIQSCGGQVVYPPGYLQGVYKHVREAGGVCVADEVQVGFGRSGDKFWAFELQDVVPDIVTMGKPMGNGHPVSAVVTTQEISDAFAATRVEYFNTFGGNPVSCSIANSVLDVIEEEKLQSRAFELGTYWMNELNVIKDRHRLIGDVRGHGLFIGVEISKDKYSKEPLSEEAKAIAYRLRQCGILVSRDGPENNVLKIKPPMVIEKSDIDKFNRLLEVVLTDLEDEMKTGKNWTAEESARKDSSGESGSETHAD